MTKRHLMFCTASEWAPQYCGLPCKRGSNFSCLFCSLFHLSVRCDWEGPSPAAFAQILLNFTSARVDPDRGLPPEQRCWAMPLAGCSALREIRQTTWKRCALKRDGNNQRCMKWLMRFPWQGCYGIFLLSLIISQMTQQPPGIASLWQRRSKLMQES